jgi:hypothetical protein
VTGPSRIEAAQARVRSVKRSVLIAAACTFAAAMGLAKITHPGASSSAPQEPSSPNTSSSSESSSSDEFFGGGDDSSGQSDDQGGWIAPSTGAPQARTQTS